MERKNTRVLVTGGAKRLGREIVRAFAGAGARVVIHCNSSEKEAAELLDEIGGISAGHMLVKADFSCPETVVRFADTLPEDLSIVINNASLFIRKKAGEENFDEAYHQFAVNFFSPVELIKGLYRHSKMPELSAVCLLDGGCEHVPADSFSYALSKQALASAVKALAKQYAPRMRVNGVAAGPVFPPPGLEHLKMAKTLSTLPMGKPVSASEIAEAVLFAAFSGSVTGSVINVDCGRSLE